MHSLCISYSIQGVPLSNVPYMVCQVVSIEMNRRIEGSKLGNLTNGAMSPRTVGLLKFPKFDNFSDVRQIF